jgi:ERF superfamily
MEAIIPETGEVTSIAEAAKQLIRPPRYWRRTEGIVEGDPGPEYEAAFLKAQTEIGPILLAETENAFNRSKYASLPHLLAKIMPVINKHGLTQKQGCGRIIWLGEIESPRRLFLLPMWNLVRHAETGQWERIYKEIPLLKMDPQGFGSAATYGRRYLLQEFWCVAGTDDDGVLASMRPSMDADPVADAAAGMIEQINECDTTKKLEAWQERNRQGFELLDDAVLMKLREAYSKRRAELKATATAEKTEEKQSTEPKVKKAKGPEKVTNETEKESLC